MVGRCAHCGRKRETAYVLRKGGGNYRRASRFYRTQICGECAERLLEQATPGHMTAARFGISGLRAAAEKLRTLRSD